MHGRKVNRGRGKDGKVKNDHVDVGIRFKIRLFSGKFINRSVSFEMIKV